MLVDGAGDPAFRGDHGLDAEAGPEADVLDHVEVGRIDHGQGQERPDAVEGQDEEALGRFSLE